MMKIYKTLQDIPEDIIYEIDWDMTPEEAIAKHLEWGPLRSQSMYESKYGDNETYYFCINTWKDDNVLHLIYRKGFDSLELGKFDIQYTPTENLTLIAETSFIERVGNVDIDFNGMGFHLTTELPLVQASGNCGGCAC